MSRNDSIVKHATEKIDDIQLLFNLDHYFVIGSPLGFFISGHAIQDINEFIKTRTNFYNIYHPSDVIAYRLEPFLNSDKIKPPVKLPYYKNNDLRTIH